MGAVPGQAVVHQNIQEWVEELTGAKIMGMDVVPGKHLGV